MSSARKAVMRRRIGRPLTAAAVAVGCLAPLLAASEGAHAVDGSPGDLAVALSAPQALVNDGTDVTFTASLTNLGSIEVTNAAIAVTLPAGYTLVSATPAAGGTYATGTWSVPSIAAGAASTLAVVATVPPNSDGRAAVVSAVVTAADQPDTSPADDTASLTLTTRIDDLCAIAGSTTLPGYGQPIPIETYVAGDCTGATPPAAPVGPTIVANRGDSVTVRLHNTLAEASSVLFQGQTMVPDTTGAAAGSPASPSVKAYTFAADRAGTFLYEAGQLPNGARQTAMGLHGALVVRDAPPSTSYDDDAVVVVSDLDPAFNRASATFDMRNFVPRYTLINGKVHPDTASFVTGAGRRLLLRYVNAGVLPRSLGVLGLRQLLVANDGFAADVPHEVVAESLGAGQTLDAVVAVPVTAAVGTRYPLYDTGLNLHDNTAPGLGGALTMIEVATAATNIATVSALSASPTDFTATFTASSGTELLGAEYYLDAAPGTPGTGTALVLAGTTQTATTPFTTAVTTAGTHVVHVRARDTNGWGPIATTTFTIAQSDTAAPVVSAVLVTPNPATTATPAFGLTASASDAATGGNAVTAAEFTLDGGLPVPMTVTPNGAAAELSATIAGPLGLGTHTIRVRARDAAGNWSSPVATPLVVTSPIDTGAPVTSAVAGGPNLAVAAVRVSATVSDVSTGGSKITAAEGFVDAAVTPVVFLPVDGAFDSATEAVYGDFPLAALSTGSHLFRVRGRDAAGNWSLLASTNVTVERTAPTVSGAVVTPTVVNASSATVTASASDVATGGSAIVGAEMFVDTVGAIGAGIPMGVTLPASPTSTLTGILPGAVLAGLTGGNHTVHVRAMDAFGTWSTTTSRSFTVDHTAPTFTAVQLSPSLAIVATPTTVAVTVTGAADTGGAGVAGAEYTIDGGAATAFALPSTTFPAASLAVGNHTISVRVRDAVGNVSAARTANLAVVEDAIFANSFTTVGAPWGWTSRSTTNATRLNVTAAAALDGDAAGLQAQGNNTNYVQYNLGATPAATTYDARFHLTSNGATSAGKDILVAATTTGYGNQTRFRVRYSTAGVQLQVGTSTTNTTWSPLAPGRNTIEVVYQAAGSGSPNPGTLQLYVNGVLQTNQSQVITSNLGVASVRLGSVTATGAATAMYFDGFVSKRSVTPLIGG